MEKPRYKSISKSQLAKMYDISVNTLGKLLNHRYFDKLQEVGYTKRCIILPPLVITKFKEIYGDPNHEE